MGLLFGEGNKDSKDTPLARKYFNEIRRGLRKEPEDILDHYVKCMSMSSSGEWLMINCPNMTGLINTNSKAYEIIVESMMKLKGTRELQALNIRGKGLLMVPSKSKAGFDLEVGEEEGTWVIYNETYTTLAVFMPGEGYVPKEESDEEGLLDLTIPTSKTRNTKKTKVNSNKAQE